MQGGGCTSVGVVGWHIGGGYGSWSKKFGTGPANMLEAKIVTANGNVVIASEFQNEDLFYAMRGGGHGFGVVVSLTVRTHPLPEYFGAVTGAVKSKNQQSGKELVKEFFDFYKEHLIGPNWGEQVGIHPDGDGIRLDIHMLAANLTEKDIETTWEPIKSWVLQRPEDFTVLGWDTFSIPGRSMWDVRVNGGIQTPYDPKEPNRAFFWRDNLGEISAYWMMYVSRFLRVDHFLDDTQHGTEILLKFIQGTGGAGLHFNKAQFGASEWAVRELEKTPMHPSIKKSFGLLIAGGAVGHYSPLVANHLQSNTSNINDWLKICQTENLEDCYTDAYYDVVNQFREDTPGAGAYFNEADFHEVDWQENFWGLDNYKRLLEIKLKWDPDHLFYCHNCVGSEFYEEGGFCKTNL